MVRGCSKLVPWCRLIGRQLDGIRGGGSSNAPNAAIPVVVDGQTCRCLSSWAGSLAGLLDGAGGRQRDVGGRRTARFSTVADVTDVGSKSSEADVSFGASPLRDETLAGGQGLNSSKPPFSSPDALDKFLFGDGPDERGSSSVSLPAFSVGTQGTPAPAKGFLNPETSQLPETATQPRVRNDRYYRSRNNSTVANMLKLLEAAPSQEDVERILDEQIPDLTASSRWPWLALFDALQRGPKPYLALEVFNWKKDKFDGGDPREYAKMISTAGKLNQLEIATTLFRDMEEKGVKRSSITCNALISAYSKNDEAAKAMDVFTEMQNSGDCEPTLVTYNTLISMYSKLSVPDMERIFDMCKSSGFLPDRVTFNSMIWGYMRAKDFVKLEEMYEMMKASGIKPDPITFSGLIIGHSKANQIEKMELAFGHMQEEGFPISTMIAEILTEFYAVDRKFEKMERIIKITVNTPGASCSSRIFGFAIQAYAETGRIQEMEETLERMFAGKRLFTSTKTLESVITAYGSRSDFEGLNALLLRIKGLGWTYQHTTYETLLYQYGKGRELEKMEEIFSDMEKAADVVPTEETYKILADSYRAAGDVEGMKRTVDRMSAVGFKTKEVLDAEPERAWTDDEIFGGRHR